MLIISFCSFILEYEFKLIKNDITQELFMFPAQIYCGLHDQLSREALAVHKGSESQISKEARC